MFGLINVNRYPVNRFNNTSWMAIASPTDSPKSVRNRSVIEILVAFLCCRIVFLDFPVGAGAFVIGLNLISSFFSYTKILELVMRNIFIWNGRWIHRCILCQNYLMLPFVLYPHLLIWCSLFAFVEEWLFLVSDDLSRSCCSNTNNQKLDLPYMYWIPMMHNNQYKHRFIASSWKCSTKPWFILLNKCLHTLSKVFRRTARQSYSRSGINKMLILKNSKELLDLLKSPNFNFSILQSFRSWAATSHLRPPMAFLSHNSSDTPGLAPLMNVLFWGWCDFLISFSGRDM